MHIYKDVPTIKQLLKASIYKEINGLMYEKLAYQTYDSKMCNEFLKLNNKPFSKSVSKSTFPQESLKICKK